MGDVAALEAQIAFVEDTVRALDEALAVQQQHILRLERQIDRLQQQLKDQGARLDEVAAESSEPPPPHY
jgi:uncharacterized coiled-coil protein SlyX